MSSTDSSNRYRMVEAVYQQAIDLPRDRRAAFIESECAGDLSLRQHVESLLHHWDCAPRQYLESPVHALSTPDSAAALLPDRIAAYAIIRLLGRGGMGAVYEAEQQQPRRRVALKVIRSDVLSDETLRRFRHEADVLGQLRHPGIAQIYEFSSGDVWYSGARTGSQPFFAMELVQGCPLVEFAASRKLERVPALELIASVCDAVQHAHQKGVIHRDLKPSNILVDEDGRPRVLDFGVARVLQSDASDHSTHTSAGQLIGTIAYMSPERLTGQAHAADIRSDIYSLGVVAYELLTGRLPFEVASLSTPQIIRVLAERDPTPAGAVRRELRGDVQAILAKALERDPERRYGSAAELAADFRRHLRHEPISARPANSAYHFRKFVRRNRVMVAAATAVLVVMAGATVWITAAMIQAQRANVSATAINEFLRDVLAEADPATGRADVQLVEVLRDAGDQAASRFADAPDMEAEVRVLLARAFSNLSLSSEAVPHAERALELRTGLLGERHPLTLQAASHLSDLYRRETRYDDALRMAERVIALAPPELQNGKDVLDARRSRAGVYVRRDRLPEAEQELRSVLEAARTHFGPEHPVTLASANDVAWFLQNRARRKRSNDPQADLRESAEILTALLAPATRVHGESEYATLNKMANLAQTLRLSEQFDEAAEYAEKVMQLGSPRLGESHTIVCRARGVLADARYRQGKFAEAADLTIANIECDRLLAQGRDTVSALSDMSDTLHLIDAGGRLAEGEQYARVLVEKFGGAGGHDRMLPLRYRTYLARFISRQGRLTEAEALFGEILAATGSDDRQRAFTDLAYGAHLALRGEFGEGERRLLAAHAALEESDWYFVAAVQELARLYEAWERPDHAAVWRARLETPETYKSWPAEPRP